MRQSFGVVSIAFALAACAVPDLKTGPDDRVSLDQGSYNVYDVSVMPYSMGPNSEIYQCSNGFTQTVSILTADVWRHPTDGDVIASFTVNRDFNYVSPGQCDTYTGGSVGINVYTPNGWQFAGSMAADASGWVKVSVPDGARIQVVAVPESGNNFNVPYSDFALNQYRIGVYETTVHGPIELHPSFIRQGGTYGGGCPPGVVSC